MTESGDARVDLPRRAPPTRASGARRDLCRAKPAQGNLYQGKTCRAKPLLGESTAGKTCAGQNLRRDHMCAVVM